MRTYKYRVWAQGERWRYSVVVVNDGEESGAIAGYGAQTSDTEENAVAACLEAIEYDKRERVRAAADAKAFDEARWVAVPSGISGEHPRYT